MVPLIAAGQEGASELFGDYAVTIAAEDVPPELIGGASLIGRWQISFEDGGDYEIVRQDVGSLVEGQFEADGPRLTLSGETGVIACESGQDEESAAIYEWTLDSSRLLLTAVEEPCDRRRLLLTTRVLSSFAPCPELLGVGGEVSNEAVTEGASEAPGARPWQATPVSDVDATEEIDTLLKQMSDCWATRDPDRFLQLLSQDHRASQDPADENERRRYELNMAAPIVWDLAGDVALVDPDRATAQVRQTLGDNIDVIPYAFVLEEGAWRWDGVFEGP